MSFSSFFHWLRRRKWRVISSLAALLLIGGIAWFFFQPEVHEYVTATARRGNLTQTVETIGTVISERDLTLQFPRSGVVGAVYVREGDTVQAGQKLAALRAGSLAADVAAARARLDAARADLNALREGSRPEDIRITEAQVSNARASLEAARESLENTEEALNASEAKIAALRNEQATSLSGDIAVAQSTVSQQMSIAEKGMGAILDIWARNDVLDAMIKDNPSGYDEVKTMVQTTETQIMNARNAAAHANDFDSALAAGTEARTTLLSSANTLARAYAVISHMSQTSYYSATDREADKTTLATERNNVENAAKTLESGVKQLRDAAAGSSTQIAAEEAALASAKGARDKATADILTYETQLRIQQAQLDLKKAGARPTDIAAAEARVRLSQAELSRSGAEYGETVLTAPVEGTITNVAVKAGELTPSGGAIQLLGATPFRIEMFVSEIDIPKVQVTQSGSIELDAFPGVHMKLRVGEVDIATTTIDGVAKYRVKLDFIHPHPELKIGMSGDATIVTGERTDVVVIPERAVIEDEDGARVVRILQADGTVTRRSVRTGMRAGEAGDIEILSGVKEGDVVVLLEKS